MTMAINKVVKFHLEEQAYTLRQSGKSFRDIADILSGTSGTRITHQSVDRFFQEHTNLRDEIIQDIIERNDTLIATSISQSLDITAFRIRVTHSLVGLLDAKLKEEGYKDGKEIAAIAKEIREGLNDMDQTISPLLPSGAVDNNLGVTLTDDQLLASLRLTETDSA